MVMRLGIDCLAIRFSFSSLRYSASWRLSRGGCLRTGQLSTEAEPVGKGVDNAGRLAARPPVTAPLCVKQGLEAAPGRA